MWDRVGPIRGLWRILDGKGESGLMSNSELWGGNPRPWWLRIDHLAPVSKFDYVLVHMWFMMSHKLSNFDGHRVGWSLTYPVVMYTGIVYGPPTDSPACGIMWKTCTRKRWDPARLFDHCCKVWPLMVPSWLTCVVLSGYLPCKDLNWFKSLRNPRIWVILAYCSHFIEVSFHLCSYEIYVYV
jgi:hypothetical protein